MRRIVEVNSARLDIVVQNGVAVPGQPQSVGELGGLAVDRAILYKSPSVHLNAPIGCRCDGESVNRDVRSSDGDRAFHKRFRSASSSNDRDAALSSIQNEAAKTIRDG